jgi:hypothetical protein
MLQLVVILSLAIAPASLSPSALVREQTEPSLPELYALAAAKLLGAPSEQEFFILPTSARTNLTERARNASGSPRRASEATAREVATRLARRGYRGNKGMRTRVDRGDELQLVLGELRFEPAQRPTFARLIIGVIGAGGVEQSMEFLLKREPDGWRVLNMEAADNIG